MNKFLLVLLLSICSLWAVEFHSLADALKMQKQSKKIIMIDIVRTNCHYCKDMDREVFQNAQMSRWLDDRFIAVKINLDNEELPMNLEVSFTPTFYFVNIDNKIVKKIPGAWNIEDFTDLIKGIK